MRDLHVTPNFLPFFLLRPCLRCLPELLFLPLAICLLLSILKPASDFNLDRVRACLRLAWVDRWLKLYTKSSHRFDLTSYLYHGTVEEAASRPVLSWEML